MAKKSKKKKTKKPTSLKLTRKGVNFIAEWHQGEKYKKQDMDYRTISTSGTSKWNSLSVTKSATSKKFEAIITEFNTKKAFPFLKAVEFRILGDAEKKSPSDWATKTIKLKLPPSPKISVSVVNDNTVSITIEKPNDTEKKPVSGVRYEYAVVTEFNKQSVNGSTFPPNKWYPKVTVHRDQFTSGSKSFSVPTVGSLVQSQTVLVRAQTFGIRGNSPWKYSSHTFASPLKPENVKVVNYIKDDTSNTTTAELTWVATRDRAHPIDETIVQYLIGSPIVRSDYVKHEITTSLDALERARNYYRLLDKYGTLYYYDEEYKQYKLASLDILYVVDSDDPVDEGEGEEETTVSEWRYDALYHLTQSLDIPDGANFQDGKTQKDRGSAYTQGDKTTDSATLILDGTVGVDQCMWVRIAVKHDSDQNRVFSDYVLVEDSSKYPKGKLAAPTITKLETFDDTYKASITVQNNSQVAGAMVALVYQDKNSSDNSGKVIGVVQNGTAQIQCFNWENTGPITIGAYAFCGSIDVKGTTNTQYEGLSAPVDVYSLNELMRSPATYEGGEVPVSPTNVKAEKVPDKDGTVQVTWDIPWLEATGAEISWADHDDAWYSTDGPTTYTVESTKLPRLNVTGLEVGKIWYFCVRLYKQSESGEVIYGAPSPLTSCDLAEAPAIPILELSPDVTSVDKMVKASWVYTSFDHSAQKSAEIGEIIEGRAEPRVIPSLNPKTEQFVDFTPSELGWPTGSEHILAVRVHSQSGKDSAWSEGVSLGISEPPTCKIVDTSLEKMTIAEKTELALRELPMKVKIEGSNEDDNIRVQIRRYDDFAVERPDDSEYIGYLNDPIVSKNKEDGDEYIEITAEDLKRVGTQFDDGGKYALITEVIDKSGQVASNLNEEGDEFLIPDPEITKGTPYLEHTTDVNIDDTKSYYTVASTQVVSPVVEDIDTYYELIDGIFSLTGDVELDLSKTYYTLTETIVSSPSQAQISTYYEKKYNPAPVYEYFTVNWEHQAIEPTATVTMVDNDVAKISIGAPNPPEGSDWELEEGDHIDIYRLSAGKPQLIYSNAEFNTEYADPYPTIGKRGGYRIVFVTSNGDYIISDEDGERADWLDVTENAHIDTRFQYIDFDDDRVIFKFNVKFSNSWKKNFTLTHYLSGKVEGDWLAGTEHTNNISGVTIDDLVDDDIEDGTLDSLYDLAEYSNMCHIRTIEGFNYCANIEVSENSEYGHSEHPHDVTLNVTEVSNPEYDAIPWKKWIGEE